MLGSARSGQTIMVALVLVVGSFFAGYIFGNDAPIYIPQPSSNSSSSSPSPSGSLSFTPPLYFQCLSFSLYIVRFCFLKLN